MRKSKYELFLKNKTTIQNNFGFIPKSLNPYLFDFQKHCVYLACKKGRFAFFEGCGMGKTIQLLSWADSVHRQENENILILSPLAVSKQTVKEGEKFGISVNISSSTKEIKSGINITNYEKLHNFDPSYFIGVVADESSILKSYSGKVKQQMIDMWSNTPYRLSCTATPSPNDYEELGNQAEFLGICTRSEMLSMFFINDTGDTGTWRLKKHAQDRFWEWVSSWSIFINHPVDIGFNQNGFDLPDIRYQEKIIQSNKKPNLGFFDLEKKTLSQRRNIRKDSISERCKAAAKIVNSSNEIWIVWCDLNDESKELSRLIDGSVEVTGSDSDNHKEQSMLDFSKNKIKCLITKPKIAGFGMNWQNCHNMIFVGLSDSFESMYQSIRRCYRFGQDHNVNVYIITHEKEKAVVDNIKRKESQFIETQNQMREFMRKNKNREVEMFSKNQYKTESASGKKWDLYLGDCVEVIKKLKSDSIHYSLYSPPFASLFTYSNSERDMGNCISKNDFLNHFKFLAADLYRVLIPGRLMSFHCMNLPATISHDGFIGMKDFRGDLIRLFEEFGFIYHSEVCIWKDPLVQATRTKALSLAHKQISKDSSRCGQGFPDYVVTMRKPGNNPEPVKKGRGFEFYIGEEKEPSSKKTNDPRTNKYSHHIWQRYASPVWFDIRQTRTLNEKNARDKNDERHMCPLQLDVIERCIDLWTNENDIVLSPFAGIGSEGYGALNMNRKFIGIELKESYFKEAIKNLKKASALKIKPLLDI